jgi:hypothetical protein
MFQYLYVALSAVLFKIGDSELSVAPRLVIAVYLKTSHDEMTYTITLKEKHHATY